MTGQTDINGLEDALAHGAVLIDVREPNEFASGHVPGAVNVPMGRLSDKLDDLRDLGPIHLICQSGNRSSAMVDLVAGAGIDAINVAGGTAAWADSGRPLEDA